MKNKIIAIIMFLLVGCAPLAQPAGNIATTSDGSGAIAETSETPSPEPQEDPSGAVWWPATPDRAILCASVAAPEALHVRADRTEKSAVLAYLHHGDRVDVIDPNHKWWLVRTAENVEGYANSRYLQAEKCQ